MVIKNEVYSYNSNTKEKIIQKRKKRCKFTLITSVSAKKQLKNCSRADEMKSFGEEAEQMIYWMILIYRIILIIEHVTEE